MTETYKLVEIPKGAAYPETGTGKVTVRVRYFDNYGPEQPDIKQATKFGKVFNLNTAEELDTLKAELAKQYPTKTLECLVSAGSIVERGGQLFVNTLESNHDRG